MPDSFSYSPALPKDLPLRSTRDFTSIRTTSARNEAAMKVRHKMTSIVLGIILMREEVTTGDGRMQANGYTDFYGSTPIRRGCYSLPRISGSSGVLGQAF